MAFGKGGGSGGSFGSRMVQRFAQPGGVTGGQPQQRGGIAGMFDRARSAQPQASSGARLAPNMQRQQMQAQALRAGAGKPQIGPNPTGSRVPGRGVCR